MRIRALYRATLVAAFGLAGIGVAEASPMATVRSESIPLDEAAMRKELDALSADVFVDMVDHGGGDTVRLIPDTESRPWLRDAEMGWDLEFLDAEGNRLGVMPNPIESRMILPFQPDYAQKAEEIRDALNKLLTPVWRLREPYSRRDPLKPRFELTFQTTRAEANSPATTVRGRIGWRVPTRTTIFEFPMTGPSEELQDNGFRVALQHSEATGALVRTYLPNAGAAMPTFAGVAADGSLSMPTDVNEAYLPNEIVEGSESPNHTYLVRFKAPQARLRVFAAGTPVEHVSKVELHVSDTLRQPRYAAETPDRWVTRTRDELLRDTTLKFDSDSFAGAFLELALPQGPHGAMAVADFSALEIRCKNSARVSISVLRPTTVQSDKVLPLRNTLEASPLVESPEHLMDILKAADKGVPPVLSSGFLSAKGPVSVFLPSEFQRISLSASDPKVDTQGFYVDISENTVRIFHKDDLPPESRAFALRNSGNVVAFDATGRELLPLSDPTLRVTCPGQDHTVRFAGKVSRVELIVPGRREEIVLTVDIAAKQLEKAVFFNP